MFIPIEVIRYISTDLRSADIFLGGGGGRRGSYHVRMCVSKSEAYGFFFSLRTDSSREGPFCSALFEDGLLFSC